LELVGFVKQSLRRIGGDETPARDANGAELAAGHQVVGGAAADAESLAKIPHPICAQQRLSGIGHLSTPELTPAVRGCPWMYARGLAVQRKTVA
jgi:hypothetical protein